MVQTVPAASRPGARSASPALMLGLATAGFAINFWAWALLSPLGPRFKDDLDLTSFQQALFVAVPVLVGSLGRIPVGALTDRFGGRVMFPLVSFATVVPVFAQSAAIRSLGAGRTSLFGMVGPLLTIGFGWWLLDESISLAQMAGAALVLLGILMVSRR